MIIEKSHWSSNGNAINLAVPFTKVNREKRTVSGFATLDNLDQTGDVVTQEASMKAFESFRGNIREMHQPLAVGKVASFRPETFYDPATKEFSPKKQWQVRKADTNLINAEFKKKFSDKFA